MLNILLFLVTRMWPDAGHMVIFKWQKCVVVLDKNNVDLQWAKLKQLLHLSKVNAYSDEAKKPAH